MENKTKSDTQKKAMIAALEKSLGVVTTAAKNIGIARDTHYRWMKEDSNYRNQVESIDGIGLDLAESKLHEQILQGNIAAIIFFLKTKGKVRGYVERSEVAVERTKPDLTGISDLEIMEAAKSFYSLDDDLG